MPRLKITAKGQVTFRQDILCHLGVRPGEAVNVEEAPGGRVELRAAPSLSTEEIGRLAAEGWVGKR
jgi:hypothetical protein